MATDAERMMADLGLSRRDAVSAPEESGKSRAAVVTPREQAAIQRKNDSRRQRTDTAKGGPEAETAVKLAAWNSERCPGRRQDVKADMRTLGENSFEHDAVTSQLEDRYGGQGHRAALSTRMAAGADFARGDNYPFQRSEEREAYLRERNGVPEGPAAGRDNRIPPPGSHSVAQRDAHSGSTTSRRAQASAQRFLDHRSTSELGAPASVPATKAQRPHAGSSTFGTITAAALRRAAARGESQSPHPIHLSRPFPATTTERLAPSSRTNIDKEYSRLSPPPHPSKHRSPAMESRIQEKLQGRAKRQHASSLSSTGSSTSTMLTVGQRAAAALRTAAANGGDARPITPGNLPESFPRVQVPAATVIVPREVLAIAETEAQLSRGLTENHISALGSHPPVQCHIDTPLENTTPSPTQVSHSPISVVASPVKSNRAPRAANIFATASPAFTQSTSTPPTHTGGLLQSKWASSMPVAGSSDHRQSRSQIQHGALSRSPLLSRGQFRSTGPTHAKAEALINYGSTIGQCNGQKTSSVRQKSPNAASRDDGASIETVFWAFDSPAPKPTVMSTVYPDADACVKEKLGSKGYFDTLTSSKVSHVADDATMMKPKGTAGSQVLTQHQSSQGSTFGSKASENTPAPGVEPSPHTASDIHVYEAQALYYAAKPGDESDDYYTKYPDRKQYFGKARDLLIKHAFALVEAGDDHDVSDYVRTHPERAWILNAAKRAKQQVKEDNEDTIRQYCIANPNHKAILRAAQCIYSTKPRANTANVPANELEEYRSPPPLVSCASSDSSDSSSASSSKTNTSAAGTIAATFYDLAGTFLGIHQTRVALPVHVTMNLTSRTHKYDPRSLITAVDLLADRMQVGVGSRT